MRTALLSEVADVYTGTAPASTVPGPRSLFIQIKDLDVDRRALVSAAQPIVKRATAAQPGDVLMAARGERGVTVLADQELYGAYPSLDVYLIRPQPDRLEASYLMAFLNQIPVSAGLRSSTAGSLVSRIPKPALDHLLLPLPDLHKQRAIGQLAAAAQAEQALTTRLHKAQQHLRERQLAAAFASLN